MTFFATHTYGSIAANAADERSARAQGVGASMRTPDAKRKPSALCPSFAELDLY